MKDEYKYNSSASSHTESYIWKPVHSIIRQHFGGMNGGQRLIDVGCGNGAFLNYIKSQFSGLELIGIEPSESGVAIANKSHPDLVIEQGSGYDNLFGKYGSFDIVTSIEVVEHVYSPRQFASTLLSLLAPNGIAVVTTPYHGYTKNLALAVTGKLDAHFTALWDHGHIKFWSVRTLSSLLKEVGFGKVDFKYAGRFPLFAKSMIAIATK